MYNANFTVDLNAVLQTNVAVDRLERCKLTFQSV